MKFIFTSIKGKKKQLKVDELTQIHLVLDNGDEFTLTHYPGDRYSGERLKIGSVSSPIAITPSGSNTVFIKHDT